MALSIRNLQLESQRRLIATLGLDAQESRLETQILLETALQCTRAWLISHAEEIMTDAQLSAFDQLLGRRLNGEPLAYILGEREFFGLKLKVTPATLIPRPDTEMLVETALATISDINRHNKQQLVADLGTGSGAIALAIAKNKPDVTITAIDASDAALAVAKENAAALKINNVTFLRSNWFENLVGCQFDLIVSNPPYIAADDPHLSQGDLVSEPMSALASGDDGLRDIRHIISHSLLYLKPQGWLMLEHGYDQAQAVHSLLAEAGFTDIKTIKDLADNDRVSIGKNPLIVSTHWD